MELEQALIELIDSRIDARIQQLEERAPVQWHLKDVAQYLNLSTRTVNDRVMIPNQEELDVNNGGFVHYPKGHGDPMVIAAGRMKKWIEENPDKIL